MLKSISRRLHGSTDYSYTLIARFGAFRISAGLFSKSEEMNSKQGDPVQQ